MRLFPFALFLIATPAAVLAEPAAPDTTGIERMLRDPATAQKIDRSLEALSDALLDLEVGGIAAAAEGRTATPAERATTVREMERRAGRDPEAIRRQVREAGPAIAKSMNALADALPAMTGAMEDIQRVLERVTANMPDPTYPKR